MAAGRRRERRWKRRRGSALVLAILILLAMLGLGMVAMQSTTRNLASTSNLRLSKQARYLAEMGLYHAITLLQAQATAVLGLRPSPSTLLQVDSNGQVSAIDENGNVTAGPTEFPVPPFFAGGVVPPPNSLGQFGARAGLVPSYRVVVDGFTPGPPRPGYDLETLERNNETFCLMHFTARGFVADRPLPTPADLARSGRENLFAEFRVTASVVLGRPVPRNLCTRL